MSHQFLESPPNFSSWCVRHKAPYDQAMMTDPNLNPNPDRSIHQDPPRAIQYYITLITKERGDRTAVIRGGRTPYTTCSPSPACDTIIKKHTTTKESPRANLVTPLTRSAAEVTQVPNPRLTATCKLQASSSHPQATWSLSYTPISKPASALQ